MSCSVLTRKTCSTSRKNRRWLTVFGTLVARLGRAWERQRAMTALHRLSDYQLKDIGLTRGEITRVVRNGRFDYDA